MHDFRFVNSEYLSKRIIHILETCGTAKFSSKLSLPNIYYLITSCSRDDAGPWRRTQSPRRASPQGRRRSPAGRRFSPTGRRDSPPGRSSPPGRRRSPAGRKSSPPSRGGPWRRDPDQSSWRSSGGDKSDEQSSWRSRAPPSSDKPGPWRPSRLVFSRVLFSFIFSTKLKGKSNKITCCCANCQLCINLIHPHIKLWCSCFIVLWWK